MKKRFKWWHYYQGAPLFCNIEFPGLFHDPKMKIHDQSAQHIFISKQYTTYECIPELVVTVPSARSTIVKKIKPRVYLHIFKYFTTVQHEFIRCSWSCVTFTEKLSAVVKILWHYHHFPWLSMTFAIFHDFPGWKIFLNSTTFNDQGKPCITYLMNVQTECQIWVQWMYLFTLCFHFEYGKARMKLYWTGYQ